MFKEHVLYEKKLKRVLVTHDDLDGIGCRVLFELLYQGNSNIEVMNVPCNVVNTVVGDIVTYNTSDHVTIADVSVNKELAECIDTVNGLPCKYELIDHHATALFLNQYEWASVVTHIDNVQISATQLLHDRYKNTLRSNFCSNVIDELVKYITLWDTFRFTEYERTDKNNYMPRYLNYLFQEKGIDKTVEILKCLACRKTFEFDKEILERLKKTEDEVNDTYDKIHPILRRKIVSIDNKSYSIASCNAFKHLSEVSNMICKNDKTIDFLAIIDIEKETISLRSVKEDVDVSVIAKKFGGGGHKQASGFTLNKEFLELIKIED